MLVSFAVSSGTPLPAAAEATPLMQQLQQQLAYGEPPEALLLNILPPLMAKLGTVFFRTQ
jgi:hypothetical protein